MKKWALGIFAALAVGYFGLLPFESTDAGELYVVETLLVEADENQVRLYSGDTMGSGATPAEAVQDMERKAPGQLFLRQTKRLIFCDGAEQNCNPHGAAGAASHGGWRVRCGADSGSPLRGAGGPGEYSGGQRTAAAAEHADTGRYEKLCAERPDAEAGAIGAGGAW